MGQQESKQPLANKDKLMTIPASEPAGGMPEEVIEIDEDGTVHAPEPAIKPTHEAADAFWAYWKENGETHKHGYYESTWGAINNALRTSGVVMHNYRGSKPLSVVERLQARIGELEERVREYARINIGALDRAEQAGAGLREALDRIQAALRKASDECLDDQEKARMNWADIIFQRIVRQIEKERAALAARGEKDGG